MTLFARLLERRDTSYQSLWGADREHIVSTEWAGKAVTRESALGLSAVFACVRFIVDAVSTLPVHVYAGSALETDQPKWLTYPVPRDPSTTLVVHLQQVLTSLLLDGNSYTLAAPNVFDPAELRVLDPRRVEPVRQQDGSVTYKVRDDRGQPVGEFDWTQMIHIPLIRLPGEAKGISPLEAERQTFSAAIAAEELGARFMKNGAWMSAVVEVPKETDMTEAEAQDMQQRIEAKYAGTSKAGRIGVLTGGATFRTLSVTPEQAQFLETRQYDDERIFRIYRVPPALAGMVREGATSNASSVSQALAFEKHTVRPLVTLVETGYRQLVGFDRYLKFNTKGLLRGDPETQSRVYHNALSDQYVTKDEVRAWEDLPPREDVSGLLQTPNNNAPGGTPVAA